jgi:5-methylthioadenosine/S-adenosylhomocysteine deaminase
MWGVAKQTGLIHTIGDPDYRRWPDAGEILDCLFRGGATAMRRGDSLGAIEVGRLADLALIDLDTAAFTPLNDIRRQLVFCENGGDVRKTMVAGRIVYDGTRLTTVDEVALRAEARAIFDERKGALTAARTEASRWLHYYEAMVARAAGRDVGMNRWLGYSGT